MNSPPFGLGPAPFWHLHGTSPATEAEQRARAEGKTLSAILQDALRAARAARLIGEY